MTDPTNIVEANASIWQDNHYCSDGQIRQSIDVPEALMGFLRNVEEVAALAKRTQKKIFDVRKTTHGTELTCSCQEWPLLFDLAWTRVGVPPNHELSESVRSLRPAQRSVFGEAMPLTGDPSRTVFGTNVLEGELINRFSEEYRDKLRSKAHRERARSRKQEVANRVLRMSRYLERCRQMTPWTEASRYDIGYNAGVRTAHDLKSVDRLFREYLGTLVSKENPDRPFGYLWKREFFSEIGFRHHLIVFHDGTVCDGRAVATCAAALWTVAAGKQASFLDYADLAMSYRSAGIGPLNNAITSLREGLRRLVQRDVFLRLTPNENFPQFGFLSLPHKRGGDGVVPHAPMGSTLPMLGYSPI